MSMTPEGGFTMEWIGQKLLEIERKQQILSERLAQFEERQCSTEQKLQKAGDIILKGLSRDSRELDGA